MKLIPGAFLSMLLLLPAAGWAAQTSSGPQCGCEKCSCGKTCKCDGECKCEKCDADCGCDKQ